MNDEHRKPAADEPDAPVEIDFDPDQPSIAEQFTHMVREENEQPKRTEE
jgi:hypothetical protein